MGTNNPPHDSNSEHRKMRDRQQHVCKEMNQYTNNTNRKWFLSFSIEWTIGARFSNWWRFTVGCRIIVYVLNGSVPSNVKRMCLIFKISKINLE